MVVEIANLSTKEHVLLDECRDLLSMITAMQVNFVSEKELVKLKVFLQFSSDDHSMKLNDLLILYSNVWLQGY